MNLSEVIDNSRSESSITKRRDLFCDVTLEVEGGSDIRAHKNILASCSPYFCEVFTNFNEHERIKIEDIQHSTLEQLIDYIYTSKILITEENVQSLYQAAKFLQLTDVCDACCEFMKSHLEPFNCFGILDFADKNGCEELLSFTNEYVEKNFWQNVKHDEFLELTPLQISQLISSDFLAMPFEEIIFESDISWMNFDIESRKKYLAKLIEHVQTPPSLRKYLIERVEKEPLLKIDKHCQQFIIKDLKYQLFNNQQKMFSPLNQPKVLLVIGSWVDPAKDLHDEYYDIDGKKWYRMSERYTARFGTKLAVIEGRIYKIGDPDGKSINVYDSFIGEWSKCKDMTIHRESFDVAVLDNCIYVVGGEDDKKSLDSVEIYDPRKNEWQIIPTMIEKRFGLGVGVINDCLYAVGGRDHDLRKNLSSAERYDPETKKWESIAKMSAPRFGAGVGVIDDILYAVGGSDGESVVRTVEAYNPVTNKWKLMAEMSECRSFPGVAVFDGILYVVGGFDEISDLTSVEVFSPATNSWTTLSDSMRFGRYKAGVAITDRMRVPPPLTFF